LRRAFSPCRTFLLHLIAYWTRIPIWVRIFQLATWVRLYKCTGCCTLHPPTHAPLQTNGSPKREGIFRLFLISSNDRPLCFPLLRQTNRGSCLGGTRTAAIRIHRGIEPGHCESVPATAERERDPLCCEGLCNAPSAGSWQKGEMGYSAPVSAESARRKGRWCAGGLSSSVSERRAPAPCMLQLEGSPRVLGGDVAHKAIRSEIRLNVPADLCVDDHLGVGLCPLKPVQLAQRDKLPCPGC
jgi:hypothetical protein